jgi:hypothetical protein
LGNLQGKTICNDTTKAPEGRGDPAFGFPEPILAALELRDELALLNPYYRLEVQSPYDCGKIQIVYLAERSWT